MKRHFVCIAHVLEKGVGYCARTTPRHGANLGYILGPGDCLVAGWHHTGLGLVVWLIVGAGAYVFFNWHHKRPEALFLQGDTDEGLRSESCET